jgi:1-deoxy-D-xylulose-5-phosphate reductoisomerase
VQSAPQSDRLTPQAPPSHARRDIVLLGSTGSIGTQAADIVRRNPERFRITGLAAGGSNPQLLAAQALEFGAQAVAIANPRALPALRQAITAQAADLKLPAARLPKMLAGPDAVASLAGTGTGLGTGTGTGTGIGIGSATGVPATVTGLGTGTGSSTGFATGSTSTGFATGSTGSATGAPAGSTSTGITDCDIVLNAVTGAVGLAATLAALDAGRILALANKESLIMGGPLVQARARPGQIVPVDSEHSAIAQCLRGGTPDEVRQLVLTASGGPFLHRSRDELHDVTPEQAMAHPTWSMGPVITINSATLVNKGLELIEAHLLFGVPFDRIEVVVHRQSVIHSMVEFTDGSTIAQASPPDMRIPIALGMAWPHRVPGAAAPCDWTTAHQWTFEPLDEKASPAVALAREAGIAGGAAPAIYNAANEECVSAFLAGRIPFTGIVDTVAQVLSEQGGTGREIGEIADVLTADRHARDRARELTGLAS